MRNSIIDNFQKRVFAQAKVHPDFRPGDTLRVHYKIEEAAKVDKKDKKAAVSDEKKFRIQIYEGVCISYRKGGQGDSTFAVRKIGANSVGVERVFPLHSPYVDKIEIVSGGRVRRSRLYYLRDLSGKAARIRARRLPAGMATSTVEVAAASEA